MGNGTSGADGDQPFFHFDNISLLVKLLICLCGAVGNVTVFGLLGFRLKRSPFSFYMLSLAGIDGIFLLVNAILYIRLLLQHELKVWGNFWATFQLIRLGLVTAVSTFPCFSVPCPLRLRWPCLTYFSSVMFLLICVLAACLGVAELVCEKVDAPCDGLDGAYVVTVVVTLLVLCMSSLTLLVRVQCSSRRTWPCRLHVALLLTVLAFLLLELPYTVHVLVLTIVPDTVYVPGLWVTLGLAFLLNHAVNPVIYFFLRRYRQRLGRTPLQEVLQRAQQDEEEGLNSRAPSSPQTPLRPLSSGERAAGSELPDRPPSRAAAQETRTPAVSLLGPCVEEAAAVLRH